MERPLLPDNVSPDRPVISGGYAALARLMTGGDYSLDLLIDGVHCAGCIQRIESKLGQQSDVASARLNFSTGRLNVIWHGAVSRADELVEIVKNLGYGVRPFQAEEAVAGTQAEEKFLLLCLAVAGFAMGNIMLLSIGVWSTSGEVMGMAVRDFLHLISGLIAIPAVMYSGRPFFRSALAALANRRTNMDVPISIGVMLTCAVSIFQTLRHHEDAYFDSVTMLLFFLLIGRYLDVRARRSARSAATNLLESFAAFATVIEKDRTRMVPVRDLREEMQIRIAAGEKVPIDGEVISGTSTVDTSLVTGETLPRVASIGEKVYAGTVNLDAPLMVRVLRVAEQSLLADIVRLMEKAGQGQARYVRLAERAARLYTPVVHSAALLAFLGWWLMMGVTWDVAMIIAASVLIITCPCALGLAVPVVQVLATGQLMRGGILVKSGDALERLSAIDVAVFDKTGTLTIGRPVLVSSPDTETLQLAASLAVHSVHPLSKAVAAAYTGPLLAVDSVVEHPGQGIAATYQGKDIRLGSRRWCGDVEAPSAPGPELWFAVSGRAPYQMIFEDSLKEDAKTVLDAFRQRGIKTILLSGDTAPVVEKVAGQTGMETWYAAQTPPEKFKIIEDLKAQGHKILMVGDGLNDAPVLAGADVSIAPGSAVDMAKNAADIVVMGDQLAPVLTSYHTAVFAQKLVRENFLLAVIYNVLAVPLAVVGMVTPLVAALAMSGSSLVVIANSFRLRGVR